MAKAYQYTADGYYAEGIEDYDLLPNNATHTAPAHKDGYIPRWTGKKWEQVEDHKGKEGYVDGKPHTIKDYGPLPEGWNDTPPPPSLAEARAAKTEEIHRGFDAALTATLTMPSNKPGAADIATEAALFAATDPVGLADVRAILAARRAELEAAVGAAQTVAAVRAVEVAYPV